jgi:hypothetical protein
MVESQHFQILTPEGMISEETFAVVEPQPRRMPTGCVLVVRDGSGKTLTVHQTRLIPTAEGAVPGSKSVCLSCGRVEGVVEDRVLCPHDAASPCHFLQVELRGPAIYNSSRAT